MAIDDDITFLERVPTLSLLGRQALRILAIGAESRYVHSGELLFRRGEEADGAYVIQEGRFTLSSKDGDEAHRRPMYAAGRGRAVQRDPATGHRARARALDRAADSPLPVRSDAGQFSRGGAQAARNSGGTTGSSDARDFQCARGAGRARTEITGRHALRPRAGLEPAHQRLPRKTSEAEIIAAEPRALGRHSSSVAVTGTWSEGRNQPRKCLSTRTPVSRSASAGATQM